MRLSANTVVAHPRTPLAGSQSIQGVDASTGTKVHDAIRRSYQYTLAADYGAMDANTTVPWWSLVADITTLAVANATGLPRHRINVTDIRKGSVVTMLVSFDVWVPGAFNTIQASKVGAAVLAPCCPLPVAAAPLVAPLPCCWSAGAEVELACCC